MSSILAISIVFASFAVIAAPALAAQFRIGLVKPAIAFYLLLFVGLELYHVGYWERAVAAPATLRGTLDASASGSSPLCTQALAQSDQAGVFVDRTHLPRVTVNAALWKQLPDQVKDALSMCLKTTASPTDAGMRIEIVEVESK